MPGRPGGPVTAGSTVQAGQTGRSREAGVTLLPPNAADCDGVARVSFLSREARRTLGAGRTGNTTATRGSRETSLSFASLGSRRSGESWLSGGSRGSGEGVSSSEAVHAGVALVTLLARLSGVSSVSDHAGSPGHSGHAGLSSGGETRRSGEPRGTGGTLTSGSPRRARERDAGGPDVSLRTPISGETGGTRRAAAPTEAREPRRARGSG